MASATSGAGAGGSSGRSGGSAASSSGPSVAGDASTTPGVGALEASAPATDGGYPAGWLYTQGAAIYVSAGTGAAGARWVGRGVNIDDIFLCGYNDSLWLTTPDQTLETIVSGLVSGWKPTFLRVSLAMDSYGTVVSWLNSPSAYRTPMTNVIDAIGENAGIYVLLTLRSDASMIGQDTASGDAEATGLPSDSSTTPSSTSFPTGTDAEYVALVDTFATSSFVLFGLSNEPGGNTLSDATIAAAMSHAVSVIRAEEDRLGVFHHVVSVQGNSWTSDISFYATTPLPYDNVVYEVHGYPPTAGMYTYDNIPVILGEYGSLTSSTASAFYSDIDSKQIPSLAWDFEPYSDCAPDLLNVTDSSTSLTATTWGSIVQSYLLSHAP
ncbi:MAG TPA: cellulase family glycosylhydrolase [Polyangiaceae bacterium]|nr:cellulase family glycosylhydrolase [Polyangiaceae bacterium]